MNRRVFRGGLPERRQAAVAAKVIDDSFVLFDVLRRGGVDRHPADRVDEFGLRCCGVNRGVRGRLSRRQDRRIHSVHFIELSDQPLEVVMAVTAEEADRLFARLKSEKIRIFYSKTPVEFGTTGEEE